MIQYVYIWPRINIWSIAGEGNRGLTIARRVRSR
jgi:hypothetical protein